MAGKERDPPEGEIEALKPPWRAIVFVSTIVVAVFMAIFTLVGRAFRNDLTPQLLDRAFGISTYLDRQIAQRNSENIDSGYSDFFQISNATIDEQYITTFYAGRRQNVSITVTGNAVRSLSRPTVPVQVIVDESHWITLEIPDPLKSVRYKGDVTKMMDFERTPLQGVHSIRLVPGGLSASDEVFVRTLVLVSNPIAEPQK